MVDKEPSRSATWNRVLRPPHVVRQPRPDGLKDWGDRLTSLKRHGRSSTFSSAEPRPRPLGRVIGPDGEPVVLPQRPRHEPGLTPPPPEGGLSDQESSSQKAGE